MLNGSYSGVFVDSGGDNSLNAVCSRLKICTVHWVSLMPGYLWSCYLHVSCQQKRKLRVIFSGMWELNFFQNFQLFFSSIHSATIFHHQKKFTENTYKLRFKQKMILYLKSLILILQSISFHIKNMHFPIYIEIHFPSASISFKQRKLLFHTKNNIFGLNEELPVNSSMKSFNSTVTTR